MPIYDQKVNEETRVGEYAPIDYYANEDAATVRCVHLGIGDVMIETGTHSQFESSVLDVLMFRQGTAHPIGTPTPDELGKTVQPPVKIYFEHPDSIDVVVAALEKVKASMTAEPKERTDGIEKEK